MRLRNIAFIAALQLSATWAVAAQESNDQGTSAAPQPPQPLPMAPQDPYGDLFPTNGNVAPAVNNQKPTPIQQPVPTYESWDVLRQYPRYIQLPTPVTTEAPTDQQ